MTPNFRKKPRGSIIFYGEKKKEIMKKNVFGFQEDFHKIQCRSYMNDVVVNELSWMRQFSFLQFFCLCSALATSRKEIQRAMIQDLSCHTLYLFPPLS